MPQDAFHIRRLAKELKEELVGGKINRISQVDKDELTLIIYAQKRTIRLIISTNASNARVCLSQTEKTPAPVAPNFCMLLRKHLQGAEILDVQQWEYERIIQITLHCTTDFSECDRVLHCELMGKYSNVILTEKGSILGALKMTTLEENLARPLFPGVKYIYPKPQEKCSPIDSAALQELFSAFFLSHSDEYSPDELARFLFENVAGFAPSTARELVKIYIQQGHGMPVWQFIPHFFQNQPSEAHLLPDGKGGYADFFAFPIQGGIKAQTLCAAEDAFYTAKENKKGFEDKKRKLESAIRTLKKKLAKKAQDTFDRLQEAENAEENKIKGELLTANLYRMEKGMKFIELENWYDENCATIKIALDETLPPAKNAQRYFKAYNKQKRAKEILTPIYQDELREMDYADSVLASVLLADCAEDLKGIEEELIALGLLKAPKERVGQKKKEEPALFREFEKDGFKILVGRNNIQNDKLLRLASPNDIWLHTQKYHSSHVIIVVDGRQVRDEIILYAAKLCAYYSDGRGGEKVPVDYCQRKFVKKPNKAKAGFVVYTDYKTVLVSGTKAEP